MFRCRTLYPLGLVTFTVDCAVYNGTATRDRRVNAQFRISLHFI